MEGNKSLHRRLDNCSDGISFAPRRFTKFRLEEVGDASHGRDCQVGTLIGNEILAEKIAEVFHDQCPELAAVEMATDKLAGSCQIAIG